MFLADDYMHGSWPAYELLLFCCYLVNKALFRHLDIAMPSTCFDFHLNVHAPTQQ